MILLVFPNNVHTKCGLQKEDYDLTLSFIKESDVEVLEDNRCLHGSSFGQQIGQGQEHAYTLSKKTEGVAIIPEQYHGADVQYVATVFYNVMRLGQQAEFQGQGVCSFDMSESRILPRLLMS